jgi:hypothetical protein
MLGKQAEFFEGFGVNERGNSLAGGELALFFLFGKPIRAASLLQVFAILLQRVDEILHRFGGLGGHFGFSFRRRSFSWRHV